MGASQTINHVLTTSGELIEASVASGATKVASNVESREDTMLEFIEDDPNMKFINKIINVL